MRTTEQILAELSAATQAAQQDPDLVSFRTRAAFEVRIREAKEEIVRLKAEYRSRLFANSTAFFVGGPPAATARFAEIAANEARTFTYDANSVYTTLANRVWETMGARKDFTSTQLAALVEEIRLVAIEAGLKGDLPAPRLTDLRVVSTFPDLVLFIKQMVRAAMGDTLGIAHMESFLAGKAMELSFTGNVLAAVVVNATPDEASSLSSSFATSTPVSLNEAVATGQEIDETFVIKIFEKTISKPKRKKT